MSIHDLKESLGMGAEPTTPGKGRPRVVIIDDDQRVLSALRVVLRTEFEVLTADDPKRGVAEVAEHKPDVVVLDIKMPEHDGFWVFSQIRTFDKTVPIIFNSAYQDALGHQDAVASFRPFAYLTKSINVQEFLKTLRAAVAFHRTEAARAP